MIKVALAACRSGPLCSTNIEVKGILSLSTSEDILMFTLKMFAFVYTPQSFHVFT